MDPNRFGLDFFALTFFAPTFALTFFALDFSAPSDFSELASFPVNSLNLWIFGSSAGLALAFSALAFSTCRVCFAGFFPSPYDAIRT